MSPRPSVAATRRPQLLEATLRVVAARGLDGTRLADVAAEAGLSVGAVQHHFGSRRRLLLEAFAHERRLAIERWLGAVGDNPDPWQRVVALADFVVHDPELFRERWGRWLEFAAIGSREPALRAELAGLYQHWREPFRRAVADGVGSGRFRPALPVEDVVDRIVATLDGLALRALLDAGIDLERMRDLLVRCLAHDLGVCEAGS